MSRRLPALALAATTALALGSLAPAAAQEFLVPFVTVNTAPEDAKVAAGDHFEAAEFDSIRPLSEGPVGPLPVFFADDEFGCQWTTAMASGVVEWIALAQRGGPEPCNFFQTKFTAAALAGADALIIINNAPGPVSGLAVGPIPGVGIDQTQGQNLRDSLDPSDPEAVTVTLELLDLETLLPPGAVRPTSVDTLSASRSNGNVEVAGRARFGGEAPVVLGEDPEGDPPVHPQLAALGIDATEIAIGSPDPFLSEIEFVIRVTELNAPPAPEFIRYLWQFQVEGEEYWIQAKTSDVTTTTAFLDDPQGSVQHIPGSFRLRGNCGTIENTGIATCRHLAWLDGEFDTGADEVRVRLPLDLEVAPAITAGAAIDPENGMTASIQAAVSNNATSDTVFQDFSYTIPQRTVEVGIVPAGAPAEYTQTVAASPSGAFSATLDASGLAPGEYDVHARACYGSNCDAAVTTVTL